MNKSNNKQGKVIRILSNNKLIINLGKNDGVYMGDRFQVYEPGEEIKDINGHNLGRLDYIKANVQVQNVFSNFSIVQDVTEHKETRSSGALSALQSRSREVTIRDVHPLNVNDKQIRPLKVRNKKINIGDPIK